MFGVIIGIDIKDFSKTSRTDEMQNKRGILAKIISDAVDNLKIFEKRKVIDIGDGCFILIDSGDYENILLGISRIQLKAKEDASLFFRGIVHVGKYEKTTKILDAKSTTESFVGEGINDASRYLEAQCLKDMLRKNNQNFVYGISNELYMQVHDQKYFIESHFSRYGFKVKNYNNQIFLNTVNILNLPETEKILDNSDYKVKNAFLKFINRSDFVYQKDGETSDINTFFIFPDVLTEKPELSSAYKANSEDVLNSFLKYPTNIAFSGNDQFGKTSLAKIFFMKIYEQGNFLPIFLSLQHNEKGKIQNKINAALLEQYGRKFNKLYDKMLKILIIDDFHLIDKYLQKDYIEHILSSKNIFSIVFVDSLFSNSIENIKLLNHYKFYTIREFGHKSRFELINKWIMHLNIPNEKNEILDELSEYIENTFVKGIIPYSPFYILTTLAARSDFVPLKGELTSKGHCYQALIYISLRKINIPDNEIGAFLNILSNISMFFYSNNITSFSENELICFLDNYSKDYNIPFDIDYFINKIANSSVFSINTIGQYSFYASYLFHYFVAKYLSDHLSEVETKQYIKEIYGNLDINLDSS